jgi:hypothetical protein
MRIAYFDCASGISGDMTLGALLDAGASLDRVLAALHSLGLNQVQITTANVKKCGFRALQVKIEHPPEKTHRHLHHIEAMFERGTLTTVSRGLASKIFHLIGEAEAKVHGTDIKKVHFHEVGAIDSIADIVGVSVALEELGVERVEASPVPTGIGSIQIDHGLVSVPAPATAELLMGIPLAPSEQPFELTTPTGAAILRATCQRFGSMPSMKIERIGYGAGSRDLQGQPNLLRVLLGEAVEQAVGFPIESDQVWVLETNVDDVSGADLAVALEKVWQGSPLDVYQTPCMMKKGRAGMQMTVLCTAEQVESIERILFDCGVTIGIRRYPVHRHKLQRTPLTVNTSFGKILGKRSLLPSGTWRYVPEMEAVRAAANHHSVSEHVVREAALEEYRRVHQ